MKKQTKIHRGARYGPNVGRNVSHGCQIWAKSGPKWANQIESNFEVKKSISNDIKFLECPECAQTFQLNDFGSYKRHCRQHSVQRSSGPFACHDCQKSFAEPAHLQEHLDTHSNFTASVCGICRTFFSSPSYLAEHLQAAHGHVIPSSDKHEIVDEKPSHLHTEGTDGLNVKPSVKQEPSFLPASSTATVQTSANSSTPFSTSSSSSASIPASSKRHPTGSKTPPLFTVHTPKGLEVQKLPADAPQVTTASPDSSYDEAKYILDSQPGSSNSVKSGQSSSRDTNTPSDPRDLRQCESVNSACSDDVKINASANMILNLPKRATSEPNSRDETESNSSDRMSVDSVSLSLEGSRASSPRGDDPDKYYKHKKYSRHRKRVNSNATETGSESDVKVRKSETSTPPATPPTSTSTKFDQSVSSSGMAAVGDCESSSSDRTTEKLNSAEGEKHSAGKGDKQKSRLSACRSGKSEDKKDQDMKFKWERLTRSQVGKAGSQPVSYSS